MQVIKFKGHFPPPVVLVLRLRVNARKLLACPWGPPSISAVEHRSAMLRDDEHGEHRPPQEHCQVQSATARAGDVGGTKAVLVPPANPMALACAPTPAMARGCSPRSRPER